MNGAGKDATREFRGMPSFLSLFPCGVVVFLRALVPYLLALGHTDYAEEVMKKYLIGAIHPDEAKARHEIDTGTAPPINPR